MAKEVHSYIKDTNHFLQKLNDLEGLPQDAISCTVDLMNLYPSIPHDEGLEFIREALNSRGDQSVSTETLVELTRLVLKTTFLDLMVNFYSRLGGQL